MIAVQSPWQRQTLYFLSLLAAAVLAPAGQVSSVGAEESSQVPEINGIQFGGDAMIVFVARDVDYKADAGLSEKPNTLATLGPHEWKGKIANKPENSWFVSARRAAGEPGGPHCSGLPSCDLLQVVIV
jgi:hypothetical protein